MFPELCDVLDVPGILAPVISPDSVALVLLSKLPFSPSDGICPPLGIDCELGLLERELGSEAVDALDVLEGIPVDDEDPVCPDADVLEELLDELELDDELEELDEELEDEEDELEDEELLLDESCDVLVVTEVWQALNPRVSNIMINAIFFMVIIATKLVNRETLLNLVIILRPSPLLVKKQVSKLISSGAPFSSN